jgi:hypothetical protein
LVDKSNFIVIKKVHGELIANIIKSHLESEGIPVFLKYESAGMIFAITVDGIGEIQILVPQDRTEEASKIIEPMEIEKTEDP